MAETSSEVTITYDNDNGGCSNLVKNGDLFMESNQYFEGLEYSVPESEHGTGCLIARPKSQTTHSMGLHDNFIKVSPHLSYRLQIRCKREELLEGDDVASRYDRLAINLFDQEKNRLVTPRQMFNAGTITSLTKALELGDTTIEVEDASSWFMPEDVVGAEYKLRVAICGEEREDGFQRSPDSISLYVNQYTPRVVSRSGNILTLDKPWDVENPNTDSGAWPIGQSIRQSSSGGSYHYGYWDRASSDWQTLTMGIFGYNYSGTYSSDQFRPETRYIKIGMLSDKNVTLKFDHINLSVVSTVGASDA